jgi:hypothetical protein
VSQILTGLFAFGLVFTLSAVKSLAEMGPFLSAFTNYLLSATTSLSLSDALSPSLFVILSTDLSGRRI